MRAFLAVVSRLARSILLLFILVSLLAVALAPLSIISRVAIQGYEESRTEVVNQSTTSLNEKAFEGLQGRTLAIANNVADFMRERESDIRALAGLPRSDEAYLGFALNKTAPIWTIDSDGGEVTFYLSLYREVAFIDTTGQEVIKASNECSNYPTGCSTRLSSGNLLDVSRPANTLLKNEDYFAQAMKLQRGEVYVGPVRGLAVPYEDAYAGAQNRAGQRYRGIIRLATPVYDSGKKVGVAVIAVETLHLIELTAHIAPANPALQAEIDPREADFAYLVDPEGWTIASPRHFNIVGLDKQGKLVPSINEADRDNPDNLFRPGNLTQMGFIDAAFPEIVTNSQSGGSGMLTAKPLGRENRVLSYATIPYYGGAYNTPEGFGEVVLSTDGKRFTLDADFLGLQLGNRLDALTNNVQQVAYGALGAAVLLAIVLAASIALPIVDLTRAAQEIEKGRWDTETIDPLAEKGGGGEISRLSRVFASMAKEVRSRELALKQRVQELEIVIERSKLEERVAEIAESDFFKDLTIKAKDIRARKTARSKGLTEDDLK